MIDKRAGPPRTEKDHIDRLEQRVEALEQREWRPSDYDEAHEIDERELGESGA